MIDAVTSAVTERSTVIDERQSFGIDPPASNPFIDARPLAFVEEGNAVVVDRAVVPIRESRKEHIASIVDDMLIRSQRDVTRLPASERAHVNLGLALLNKGSLDEAANAFTLALDLIPSEPVARASLARVRVLQGRLDEAEYLYALLRDARPSDPEPRKSLAEIATRKNEIERAIELWRDVIELVPDEATPRYYLGILLLGAGKKYRREAIAHLKAAARTEVRSPAFHHGLAVAYTLEGQLRRSVNSYRAALALQPNMPDAVRGLAEVLLRLQRTDEAVDRLIDYLVARPGDVVAREMLAKAYMDRSEYAAARSQLVQALEWIAVTPGHEADRARVQNNVGVCFVSARDRVQARWWFERAVALSPRSNAAPYHNLARLLIEEQRLSEARKLIDTGAEVFPDDEELPVLLAVALEAQGRYDDAAAELRRLVEAGKASAPAYGMLGALLVDQFQKSAEAVALLLTGLAKFPKDAWVGNNLAYAYLMDGDRIAARRILEAFDNPETDDRRVDGRDVALTATWGLLAFWEGRLEEGVQAYRRAERTAIAQRKPRLARTVRRKMHLELARAHIRLGDHSAAEREIRAGLSVKGFDVYCRDLVELRDSGPNPDHT
jgi:Flp pilus assembly protein TadD